MFLCTLRVSDKKSSSHEYPYLDANICKYYIENSWAGVYWGRRQPWKMKYLSSTGDKGKNPEHTEKAKQDTPLFWNENQELHFIATEGVQLQIGEIYKIQRITGHELIDDRSIEIPLIIAHRWGLSEVGRTLDPNITTLDCHTIG